MASLGGSGGAKDPSRGGGWIEVELELILTHFRGEDATKVDGDGRRWRSIKSYL